MSPSKVRLKDAGEWEITEEDLEAISLGAAILGTGGGGSPYIGWLRARRQLREGRRIRIADFDRFADDDLVVPVSSIGAPTVGIEKIDRGDECLRALEMIEEEVGRPAVALMTDEIGGANAMEPMIVGALKDIPVLDADGMGRAFPEVQMTTFFIYGHDPYPAALCDEKGNQVLFRESVSAEWLERAARAVTIRMGCTAGMAGPPMTMGRARALAIGGSVSKAWALGTSVISARRQKNDPIAAAIRAGGGRLLMRGKIVDVFRRTTEGFARGTVTLDGLDDLAGTTASIEFQNENLICKLDGDVLATVPDLICMLESETGTPVTTEELRYGFRVGVIGMPAPPELKTPEALAVVGPAAFGLDTEYTPL